MKQPSVQSNPSRRSGPGHPSRPNRPGHPSYRPYGHLLVRRPGFSLLLHRRSVVVTGIVALLLAAGFLLSLCVGERFILPGDVLKVLVGADDSFVVETLRLPRATVGLLVGLSFGIAGALIQTVARNPLASPDVIGVSHGAAAAVVFGLVFGYGGPTATPLTAVAGGTIAAFLVYVLAWRRGLNAQRFVLIGVGVSVALYSVTNLLLTKADVVLAQQAKVWMSGSLNGRGWSQGEPLLWVLLALTPAIVWAARASRSAGFDDDTAIALGIRLGRIRLGLVVVGVLLASVATGAAGPVDFVALVAPQVARRLTRTPQVPLVCSALLGALIVVIADIGARMLISDAELPVGVLTAAVGGPYLLWMLTRSRSGGAS
ncbi:FecCD family ABC transporter permease [Embleya sp. NPDC056575]|uniref:FecCD family ABC transporter permease n=1 Tax=unclassified Embleya TaxID=2699296 RepID=UPI0036B10F29